MRERALGTTKNASTGRAARGAGAPTHEPLHETVHEAIHEPFHEESCPHRPPCPGCPRFLEPGLAPETEAALRALASECGLDAPPLIEGAPFGFRHRARLAVRGRARSPKVGIFQEGSHRIADLPHCRVHHPLINRVAAALKSAMRASDTAPYAEGPHRGVVRYVQIVVERSSQSAQVVLVCNSTERASVRACADALTEELGDALHSLWWNGNPERGNSILGPHWQHLHGPECVVEEVSGCRVHFPPGAFGQANLDLADRMVERVGAWVPDDSRVVELYAGCGMMGLPLLRRCASVHFNERGEQSLLGLERSLAELSESERARSHCLPGDASTLSDLPALCGDADVLIVDPSRKGLESAVMDAIEASPPARLVYVSCGFESFLTQARRLHASGRLRLSALDTYALFPHTRHVECLALFERV